MRLPSDCRRFDRPCRVFGFIHITDKLTNVRYAEAVRGLRQYDGLMCYTHKSFTIMDMGDPITTDRQEPKILPSFPSCVTLRASSTTPSFVQFPRLEPEAARHDWTQLPETIRPGRPTIFLCLCTPLAGPT